MASALYAWGGIGYACPPPMCALYGLASALVLGVDLGVASGIEFAIAIVSRLEPALGLVLAFALRFALGTLGLVFALALG